MRFNAFLSANSATKIKQHTNMTPEIFNFPICSSLPMSRFKTENSAEASRHILLVLGAAT